MSIIKEFFTRLDESQQANITFSDLSICLIKVKSDIELQNGKELCISNVNYVPNIKSNLLCIGQLLEIGYDIKMSDLTISLLDKNSRLITHMKKTKNKMLSLKHSIMESRCMKVTTLDPSTLWYLRYEPVNFEELEMMIGLPSI